jgi:hypothetical protein
VTAANSLFDPSKEMVFICMDKQVGLECLTSLIVCWPVVLASEVADSLTPCGVVLWLQEKESGKAAVDVLGNQVGKTGGSWIMQVSAHWR